MSLHIICQCGARFTAEPHLAGQVVNCSQCGRAVQLPPPAPTPGATANSPPVPPTAPAPNAAPSYDATHFAAQPRVPGQASPHLKTVGVVMMVYGALNAGLSLYFSLQATNAVGMVPLPADYGGEFVQGILRNSAQVQYVATFLCLAFGGVQFAGGLGAFHARHWGLSVAGLMLLMIPCLGSAYPCCVILGLPLGIWAMIVMMQEKDSFS